MTPVTVVSARVGRLARQVARSPTLDGQERGRMLANVAAIEAAVRSLVAVVDGLDAAAAKNRPGRHR